MAISKQQAVQNAPQVWGGLGQTPYSQGAFKDFKGFGYRTDCSGFVSACYETGVNYSTVTLDAVSTPTTWDKAEPGDLIGHFGPGSGGDAGHVQLLNTKNGDTYTCYEQAGGGNGPRTGGGNFSSSGYTVRAFTGASGGSSGNDGGSSSDPFAPFKIFSDGKALKRMIFIAAGTLLLLIAIWKLSANGKKLPQPVQNGVQNVRRTLRKIPGATVKGASNGGK